MVNGKALLSSGGVTPTGKYQLLERIKDDSNNEIGTVSGFFTDANNVEYAVVCLDAQYRLASGTGKWCSDRSAVTNMPMYANSATAWWYNNAKETATENTTLILDYCLSNNYTSAACSHCRSQSFTIGGITYYGQLPNMRELFDLWTHRADIESADTSASTARTTNFSTARSLWSSSQYTSLAGWYLNNNGYIYYSNKDNTYMVAPVLEIPNTL